MLHIINQQKLEIKMPILGCSEYLQSKSNIYGWFAEANLAIAYYLDVKLGFKRLIFSTEVISNNSNISVQKEKIFLENIIDYVSKEKICDFIYKAQGNVVFGTCIENAVCVPWGTYEVSLAKSEEELFNSFSGKSRNVIRKALKENVKIEVSQNVEIVYENIKNMFDRQNSFHYPSLKYLTYLSQNLSDNVLFLISKKDSVVQGSLVLVYDDSRGYAMYAGSIPHPQTGSLDLLHFTAMKILQMKKVSFYDFVGTRINILHGSKQEGIDRFKKKFNPTLKKGYAFKVIINPLKHKIFENLVKLYFKVKGYHYVEAIEQIQCEQKMMKKDLK